MRKKCKNVKALFGLRPLEPCAACIMLFPLLECGVSGYFGCVMQCGLPAYGFSRDAASRLMLRLTAAVMQPSLEKGVFSGHNLTHFTGKLLPQRQLSLSAGLDLACCHDWVGLDSLCGHYVYHLWIPVAIFFHGHFNFNSLHVLCWYDVTFSHLSHFFLTSFRLSLGYFLLFN